MELIRSWLLSSMATLTLALGAPIAAQAQETDYPTRPIELVVPQSAGGGYDLVARVMATVAPEYLGQPVVIRIRPGAGTVLGLSEVARARPDGYTLGFGGPHPIVISAFEDVPLDYMNDLTLIAQMVDWPWFLVVPGDSPFDTLEEFIEHARENPGDILMANSGNLAIGHLPALELEQLTEVEFTHVPFDGGGPANASVLSSDTDAVHAVTATALPRIEDGQFKALAITGKERHPDAPDVPTYEELGYPIYSGINVGLVAPADTPPEIVERLETAMAEISQDPTYLALLGKLGNEPGFLDSEGFRAVMQGYADSSQRIAERLREAGVID